VRSALRTAQAYTSPEVILSVCRGFERMADIFGAVLVQFVRNLGSLTLEPLQTSGLTSSVGTAT